MNIKQSLPLALRDRAYMTVWVAGLVVLILLLIVGIVYIRPTDIQVPVRYSSFGITHFYNEKWFYELNFIFFGILVWVFHSLVALRLLAGRGRGFAMAFQWLTVGMLAITLATVVTILRVVSLTQ